MEKKRRKANNPSVKLCGLPPPFTQGRLVQFGGRAKDFAQLTDDIPTADVAEVKHGKWANAYSSGTNLYRCTECGEYIEAIWTGGYDFKYCPNCGAKMEGDTE